MCNKVLMGMLPIVRNGDYAIAFLPGICTKIEHFRRDVTVGKMEFLFFYVLITNISSFYLY